MILKSIHIQRKQLARCVYLTLNLGCPKQGRDVDEKRVVGHVTTDAASPTKAVREMPVLLDLRYPRRDFSIGIEIPRRVKMLRVLAKELGVAVHVPHIWDTDCTFGNEHSFVLVILDGSMWHAQWSDWPPSQNFFDHGTNVG